MHRQQVEVDPVTRPTENAIQATEPVQSSLGLIADCPELLRVRVLPAEFARLLGVSKQTVSRWIQEGKVTIHAVDGRMDLQSAIRQVLRNTDPGKMRARVLRQAVTDVQDLRANLAEAEDRAERAEAEAQRLRSYADDCDCILDNLLALFANLPLELRATSEQSAWKVVVNGLEDSAAEICDGAMKGCKHTDGNLDDLDPFDPGFDLEAELAAILKDHDEDLDALEHAPLARLELPEGEGAP
jgi:predicted transcriptional regulator